MVSQGLHTAFVCTCTCTCYCHILHVYPRAPLLTISSSLSFSPSLPPSLSLSLSSYYYAMVRDPRGDLVEASVHLLCILLDYIPPSDFTRRLQQQQAPPTNPAQRATSSVMQEQGMGNLFCSFLSRLHQNEVRNHMDYYDGLEARQKGHTCTI